MKVIPLFYGLKNINLHVFLILLAIKISLNNLNNGSRNGNMNQNNLNLNKIKIMLLLYLLMIYNKEVNNVKVDLRNLISYWCQTISLSLNCSRKIKKLYKTWLQSNCNRCILPLGKSCLLWNCNIFMSSLACRFFSCSCSCFRLKSVVEFSDQKIHHFPSIMHRRVSRTTEHCYHNRSDLAK